MAKILIDNTGKALLNSQGKAYAVANIDRVAGASPLTVTAAAGKVLRLYRSGKCTQSGTPTPSAPVDIYCNNGKLAYGIPLTLDATRINAYIRDGGLWVNSSDSYSIVVPVTIGKKYAIRLTNTASGTVSTIFRYGFSTRNTAGDTTANLVQLTQWVRSTPQDISFVELTADNPYLIIQMGASSFSSVISNGYIVVTEQALYIDGTPETLTIGQQTASVADLLGVGDYKDEQDIISGDIIRRCGVCQYDGTQTIGDVYLSTTGGKDIGAIIVYPLATPTTEQVTPQPLDTAAGANTITANGDIDMTYKV